MLRNEIAKLNTIRPNPYQNRQRTGLDAESLEKLARSIEQHELINPLVVFQKEGLFYLLAGERRWRAKCLLALVDQGWRWATAAEFVSGQGDAPRQHLVDAGAYFQESEVEIRIVDAPTSAEGKSLTVVENLQQWRPNPIEEAQGFQALLDEGMATAEVADLVCVPEKEVEHSVKLLELDPEIQEWVAEGKFPAKITAVRAILSISDREDRLGLAERAVTEGLKPTVIDQMCARYRKHKKRKPQKNNGAGAPLSIPVEEISSIVIHGPAGCRSISMCPDCAGHLFELMEECCPTCIRGGPSEACLTCDGFLEFAKLLFKDVQQ